MSLPVAVLVGVAVIATLLSIGSVTATPSSEATPCQQGDFGLIFYSFFSCVLIHVLYFLWTEHVYCF